MARSRFVSEDEWRLPRHGGHAQGDPDGSPHVRPAAHESEVPVLQRSLPRARRVGWRSTSRSRTRRGRRTRTSAGAAWPVSSKRRSSGRRSSSRSSSPTSAAPAISPAAGGTASSRTDAALLLGWRRRRCSTTTPSWTSSWVTRSSASSFRSWRAGARQRAPLRPREAPLPSVGYGSEEGPWLPLGAGVHTGAFVRRVRLARGGRASSPRSATRSTSRRISPRRREPGEILITEEVGASLETGGLERRHLSLKGHELDALVIAVEARGPASAGAADPR